MGAHGRCDEGHQKMERINSLNSKDSNSSGAPEEKHLMVFFGCEATYYNTLSEWLMPYGIQMRNVSKWESARNVWTADGSAPEYISIDIDVFECIENLVDELLQLRVNKPKVKVIIVSRHFDDDEFDTSRLSICDVSLRWPLTFGRLGRAMKAAEANNIVWQTRVLGLFRTKRDS